MSTTSSQPDVELHSDLPPSMEDWNDSDVLASQAASLFPSTAPGETRTGPRVDPSQRAPAELKDLLQQLDRLRSPGVRDATVLALLLTPHSARERQAWTEETRGVTGAATALNLVQQLPVEAAPAVLERTLLEGASADLLERIELLRRVRRLMCADGKVRPIDRLRWLLIRHVLARPYGQDTNTVRGSSGGNSDLAVLAPPMRLAVAHLTAFLARIVPMADPVSKVGAIGVAWYRAALRPWWGDDTPPCELPDGDQLVQAIVEVRTLSWMQRPVLVRTWVDSAIAVARRHRNGSDPRVDLPAEAAEALRLVSRLLDTPLPPALARYFVEFPESPPPAPVGVLTG